MQTADDVQWHPRGERVSFTLTRIENDAYRTSLCAVSVAGGPVQVLHDQHDSAGRWSPDGRRLAFMSRRDGSPALYVDGRPLPCQTRFRYAWPPLWAPDGASLLVAALDPPDDPLRPRHVTRAWYKDDGLGYTFGSTPRIWRVTLDGAWSCLTDGLAPAWSPDGARIAFIRPVPQGPAYQQTELWVMRSDGTGAGCVTRAVGRPTAPAWSPDGGRIAVYGTEPDDNRYGDPMSYLWMVDGDQAENVSRGLDRSVVLPLKPLLPAPPVWDGDSLVCLIATQGRKHVVRLRDGRAETLVGGDQSVTSFSLRDGRIACVANHPQSPSEVYLDVPLTRLNPWLDDIEWPVLERRRFRTPHGTPVDGWLSRPPDKGPLPLLLNVHGGPHSWFGEDFPFHHLYSHTLPGRRWAVLSLNPCGSGSYGRAFADEIRGHWGEHDGPEHLAAIDALVAEGVADPQRLAVAGYSYGGFMTTWLITRDPRFKAAVVGGAVTSLESFYGTSDFGPWFARWELGADLAAQRNLYRRLSPILRLDQVRTPTLVLHGEADDRCPIGQGEELFTGLMALGQVRTEFVRYPAATHMFFMAGLPSHRIDYVERVSDWVTG